MFVAVQMSHQFKANLVNLSVKNLLSLHIFKVFIFNIMSF